MTAKAKAKPTGKADRPQPLLDLSTVERVEFIKVDGVDYPFIQLDNLSLRERTKISDQLAPVLTLIVEASEKALSRNKERQLTAGVKVLVPMLIPSLTKTVLTKLNEVQRQEIIMSFFVLRSERMGGSTALSRMARVTSSLERSIGENSSPASSGSTGPRRRKRGGTKSRSGS